MDKTNFNFKWSSSTNSKKESP